jgi:hypothetical protein
MIAAYKKCPSLHDMAMWDIRAQNMQDILDQTELSHAMLEHIRNLFRQMYKYALQSELVAKDYSQYTRITKEDDDTQGGLLPERNCPYCGSTRMLLLLTLFSYIAIVDSG